MIMYRNDLKVALEPMQKNKTAEIDLIGNYEQTKDPSYLAQLRTAANNYRASASNTLAIIPPSDAVTYHVGIINATREFAATLDAFSTYATDTITAAALLMSYNQAEQDMLSSFSALTAYFTRKQP